MTAVFHLTAAKTIRPGLRDVLVVADAVDLPVTLPKSMQSTKGMRVRAVVLTASVTTGFRFVPNSGDTIEGTGITAGAGKYVKNTAATDAVGDSLELVADGAGKWLIVSKIGTWAREA